MAYCTAAQVKAIVDTVIPTADITELIEETDAFMATKVPVATLAAAILRAISRTWTAYRVMLKDPSATRIGEYSTNHTENLKGLEDEYMKYISMANGGIAFTMTSSPIPEG